MKVEIKMGCDMNFDLAHLQPCSGKSLVRSMFLYVYKFYLTWQLLQYIIWITLSHWWFYSLTKKNPRVINCQGFNLWWKRFCFIVYYTCADLGGGGLWGDLIPPSLQNSNSLNMPQTPHLPPPFTLANTKKLSVPLPWKIILNVGMLNNNHRG